MSSVVFFGAGASKPFGIPTMQDMVSEFEKNLQNNNKECFEFYTNIKKILVKGYDEKQIDIESILSVLDGITSDIKSKELGHYAFYYIQSYYDPIKKLSDEHVEIAKKTKELLKEYIKESCKIKSDSEIQDIYNKSYLPLFTHIRGQQNSSYIDHKLIIDWKAYTTNYDDIFENFWHDIIQVNEPFIREKNSNRLIFSAGNLNSQHSINHLHGSLQWTREKGSTLIIKKNDSSYSLHETDGYVMLFPIQQKDLYLHPWFSLFSDLRNGLTNKQYWYAVGYSFNDEFIRNTFEEILPLNSDKKLIIIDPNAEEIKNKFHESVKNQIDVLPIKFGDEFFKLQFIDYVKSMKTIMIRIIAKYDKILIKSTHHIITDEIIDESETNPIHVQNMGNGVLVMDVLEPKVQEIKIKLQIQYTFDEQIELSLSDGTTMLNFSIDYGNLQIASQLDVNGYSNIDTILWSNPITLDKSKLYYPATKQKIIE